MIREIFRSLFVNKIFHPFKTSTDSLQFASTFRNIKKKNLKKQLYTVPLPLLLIIFKPL